MKKAALVFLTFGLLTAGVAFSDTQDRIEVRFYYPPVVIKDGEIDESLASDPVLRAASEWAGASWSTDSWEAFQRVHVGYDWKEGIGSGLKEIDQSRRIERKAGTL